MASAIPSDSQPVCDRRHYSRIPIDRRALLTTRYGQMVDGQAYNVSSGGVFLKLDQDLAVDDVVEISLSLRLASGAKTILAQCRVAHSSIIRTDGSHRIGLVFVEIKGHGSDYLAQLMMERRGIESPTADDYENL